MNWLHTIAALRAARIENKRIASSLSVMLDEAATRSGSGSTVGEFVSCGLMPQLWGMLIFN
jgi:hypothetical protein